MKVVLTVLLVLFSTILFLMLDLLFYKPKPEKQFMTEKPENTDEIPLYSTDRYTTAADDVKRSLKLLWPGLYNLLQQTELEHVLLFRYQSADQNDPLVFVNEDETNRISLLSACSELMEHQVIERSFIIAIPLSRRYRLQAMSELDDWLIGQGIHPFMILEEGSDNEKFAGKDSAHALIGVGFAGEYTISAIGRQASEWKQQISRSLFPVHITEAGQKLFQSFYTSLPWQIRMEWHFKAGRQKAVRDFLSIMPQCSLFFQAQLEQDGEQIILRAVSQHMLDEAYASLKKDAEKYHVSLNIRKTRDPLIRTGETFCQLENALEKSFSSDRILPFILPYHEQLISSAECDQFWYMPYTEGKKNSARSAVLFYEHLLGSGG